MDVPVIIVGAGFSGLGMAVHLEREGIDFVVLERGDDIGGTWRDNRYPGCACDVPSHLYSFSFAPYPDWTRAYAPQEEIWAYMRKIVADFGLMPHVRLKEEVERAEWDGAQWRVRTTNGRTWVAPVLISGTGALSNPLIPELPGLERFRGAAFHSAQWRHDVDLTGKRVAVIGTGASAIQFVPQIAPKAAKLHLFQRTPPWILPRPDRPIGSRERRLFRRVPLAQKLRRWSIYWKLEGSVLGMAVDPRFMKLAELLARRHLAKQVPDPALRRRLTPDYTIGCKRILLSNDYYPALTRPNVALVTEPIREVTADGVVTADGHTHDADVIVFGTGFRVQELVRPGMIVGKDGLDLADAWADGVAAYKGTTVAGFPNLFFLLGPNTGLGHSSMIFMIESQIAYVRDALRTMRARGWQAVEVDADVQARYNEALQARVSRAVWQSGCRSWYLDAKGRNTTLWPGFTFCFRQLTSRFDAEAYHAIEEVGNPATGSRVLATESA